MGQRQILLAELKAKYPQYEPIMEHIEWNGSYVKDYYTNRDLKLYWWSSLKALHTAMHTLEAMIYAEGLILLYHGKLTYEYLEVACLKLLLEKAKDELIDTIDLDNVKLTIRKTYDHIIEHKEEILRADKDWRPETMFNVKQHIHKRKPTREEIIAMIDECEETTGHKTYEYCARYFVETTGLSEPSFRNYLKEYGVELEKKDRGGRRTNSGRKKMTSHYSWLDEIHEEEWKLSIGEILNIVKRRNNMLAEGLTHNKIKNWKYRKMKELGLKKTEHKKTEEKKKIIPDFNMEFSEHQIED